MAPNKSTWNSPDSHSQRSPSKQTIVISEASSPVDEWQFSDDQIGANLSQVLGRPEARRLHMTYRPNASFSSAAHETSNDPFTHRHDAEKEPLRESGANHALDWHSVDNDDSIQREIAAMFTDSEDHVGIKNRSTIDLDGDANSGNEAAENKDILSIDSGGDAGPGANSPNDGSVLTGDEGPFSARGMDFMDEESARNFQRILAEQRKTRRKTWLAGKQKLPIKPNPRRSLPHISSPTQFSDELPSDPFSITAGPSRLGKRKRDAAYKISDSEVTDDGEILDSRAIIGHRLRDKSSGQSYRDKLEQARNKAKGKVYDTDADADIDADTDGDGNGDIGNSGNGDTRRNSLAGAGVSDDEVLEYADNSSKPGHRLFDDMPETDSGSDTGKNKAVFVIEDSSDDNDFISDPEEPATKNVRSMNRPATKAGKSDPNGKMSQFLSAFEDSRSKQMLGKLNGKPDAAGSLKTPRKSVRGYSQEIDDDLADFIVDDDDDSDEVLVEDHNESALGSDSDGADQGADKRAHAFSPTFSRDKPQGALAMMPEEFSQCDLPTSFKTYVQYLVYWICNYRRRPLMNKKNAKYFFLAYVTVSRVIRSLEQSLVASSAWTEKFSNDLYSFPEYSSTKIPGCPGCDACHFHDKRTATFCIRLSGNPYKQDILAPPNPDGMGAESLADKSTFSDDSSDDVVSYPSDAHVDYNVGAVCKRRSETCHELHHYFFHLSNAVERDLGLLDYSSQSRASDLETDDGEIWDGFDPDDLVEMLEKQGRIDRLFADFKSLLSRSKIGFAKNT